MFLLWSQFKVNFVARKQNYLKWFMWFFFFYGQKLKSLRCEVVAVSSVTDCVTLTRCHLISIDHPWTEPIVIRIIVSWWNLWWSGVGGGFTGMYLLNYLCPPYPKVFNVVTVFIFVIKVIYRTASELSKVSDLKSKISCLPSTRSTWINTFTLYT